MVSGIFGKNITGRKDKKEGKYTAESSCSSLFG
jgi:hypothetical protein